MASLLQTLRNWSEIWALLIPLYFILFGKRDLSEITAVVLYVVVAFPINLMATTMFVLHETMPDWLKNNNVLYNLHSLVRVLFFTFYVNKILKTQFSINLNFIIGLYVFFVFINFIFLDNPLFLSSKLFAAESIVLLFFISMYFLRVTKDDSNKDWTKHPSFLVCVGLGLYNAITVFIFLFYYPLFDENPEFSKFTMTLHNIMFVVMCIFLAMAMVKAGKQKAAL